ncbi:MAG: Holliday junction resolvase RecU [Lachnospiraceae bacterium]|jgi:recombination protein U|nr:Holliday junction resolvase RecU [Lachnospiraceae bacterium]
MATWKSRGLRGSTLEEMINRSNEKYMQNGLALIQKIPTSITPIEIDKDSRYITKAYFEKKSTVDYIGAVQGIPVCFEAKECTRDSFRLSNIHAHQMDFMRKFEEQGGVSFVLILFVTRNTVMYLPFAKLSGFWERMQTGGRKSFDFGELDSDYVLPSKQGIIVPYLDMLNKDLQERGQEKER